jgi:hypothetical protein
MPQLLRDLEIGPSSPPPVFGLLTLQLAAGVDGLIGTIFEERSHLLQLLLGMKDVAAAA